MEKLAFLSIVAIFIYIRDSNALKRAQDSFFKEDTKQKFSRQVTLKINGTEKVRDLKSRYFVCLSIKNLKVDFIRVIKSGKFYV